MGVWLIVTVFLAAVSLGAGGVSIRTAPIANISVTPISSCSVNINWEVSIEKALTTYIEYQFPDNEWVELGNSFTPSLSAWIPFQGVNTMYYLRGRTYSFEYGFSLFSEAYGPFLLYQNTTQNAMLPRITDISLYPIDSSLRSVSWAISEPHSSCYVFINFTVSCVREGQQIGFFYVVVGGQKRSIMFEDLVPNSMYSCHVVGTLTDLQSTSIVAHEFYIREFAIPSMLLGQIQNNNYNLANSILATVLTALGVGIGCVLFVLYKYRTVQCFRTEEIAAGNETYDVNHSALGNGECNSQPRVRKVADSFQNQACSISRTPAVSSMLNSSQNFKMLETATESEVSGIPHSISCDRGILNYAPDVIKEDLTDCGTSLSESCDSSISSQGVKKEEIASDSQSEVSQNFKTLETATESEVSGIPHSISYDRGILNYAPDVIKEDRAAHSISCDSGILNYAPDVIKEDLIDCGTSLSESCDCSISSQGVKKEEIASDSQSEVSQNFKTLETATESEVSGIPHSISFDRGILNYAPDVIKEDLAHSISCDSGILNYAPDVIKEDLADCGTSLSESCDCSIVKQGVKKEESASDSQSEVGSIICSSVSVDGPIIKCEGSVTNHLVNEDI